MANQYGQVIGGGANRSQGVQAPAVERNTTGDLLLKMGQGFLQKKLEQKQQEQFVKGMQRVATGEAYQDIKSGDNPMLAGIFGPSASVAGAAAMSKVQNVDEFEAEAYQNMQGNAEMSPEKFREHLVAGMGKHLTGDPDVDNVIQTKMVEGMAPLMKAQAKANYAWAQQQSANSFNGLVSAAGNKFHAQAGQYSQGLLSKDDFEQAQGQFLSSIQPVEGMNPETYKKSVLDTAILQMNKGNMWADRIMQKYGVYDALDADDQTKLMKARESASDKLKNEYGFNKYGAAVGELVGGAAGRSPAQNHELANQLNQRYMDETGSETGLLTVKDMISMDRSVYSRMYRMQDKMRELSAKANMDARADGQLAVQAVEMAQTGKGNYAIGAGVPKNKFDSAFNSAFGSKLAAGNSDGALDLATENYTHGNGYINPQLQGMMTEPFRQITQGGIPGPEFDRTMQFLDAWTQRPESGGAVDAYLGADNVVRLQRYRDSLVAFNGDKLQASKAAWGSPVVKGPSLETKDFKPAMLEVIRKNTEGKGAMNALDRWFNNVPNMSPAAQDVVFNSVRADAETYVNNLGMSPEAAIKRALDGAGRSAVDVVGAYAIPKAKDQNPLAAMVGVDDRTLATLMPKFLQQQARKQGVAVNLAGGGSSVTTAKGQASPTTNVTDLTNWYGGGDADVSLMRAQDIKDKDGNPVAVYSGLLFRDEKNATVHFTSKDLKEFYETTIKNRNDITDTLRKAGM